MTDDFRMDGARCLVTGASRGIGRATALRCAEMGADVAIAARDVDALNALHDEITELGVTCRVIPCDFNDLDAVAGLPGLAADALGGLTVVVNNVGGSPPRPVLDTSVAMFERAFQFNVTTAFAVSKSAIPLMLAEGGGSIVNISSAIGRLTDRGFVAYGTAKAALSHFTRLLATECAPRIRVNAIAAGSIATTALGSVLTPELRSIMEQNTPLRRIGEPRDIANGVVYLCSPAGSFLTGKVLEIDGGVTGPTLELGLGDL